MGAKFNYTLFSSSFAQRSKNTCSLSSSLREKEKITYITMLLTIEKKTYIYIYIYIYKRYCYRMMKKKRKILNKTILLEALDNEPFEVFPERLTHAIQGLLKKKGPYSYKPQVLKKLLDKEDVVQKLSLIKKELNDKEIKEQVEKGKTRGIQMNLRGLLLVQKNIVES